MHQDDEAIRAKFREWDRQIARLQERCLAAPPGEADRLRSALAEVAAARETAWSRWELARAGGMWVTADVVRRFEDAMRETEGSFTRLAGAGTAA